MLHEFWCFVEIVRTSVVNMPGFRTTCDLFSSGAVKPHCILSLKTGWDVVVMSSGPGWTCWHAITLLAGLVPSVLHLGLERASLWWSLCTLAQIWLSTQEDLVGSYPGGRWVSSGHCLCLSTLSPLCLVAMGVRILLQEPPVSPRGSWPSVGSESG